MLAGRRRGNHGFVGDIVSSFREIDTRRGRIEEEVDQLRDGSLVGRGIQIIRGAAREIETRERQKL